MTLAEPELADGAEEDELPVPAEVLLPDKLLVPEDELLVPDDELPAPDFPELECAEDDPDVPVVLAVLWAAPGRVSASPPATARPRTPVPAVTAQSLAGRLPVHHGRHSARVPAVHHVSFTEASTPNLPQRSVGGVSASSAAALNRRHLGRAGPWSPAARTHGSARASRPYRTLSLSSQGDICRTSRSPSARRPQEASPNSGSGDVPGGDGRARPLGAQQAARQFRVHENGLTCSPTAGRSARTIDPDGREMLISCGGALFGLRLGLRHLGYQTTVELLPDPGHPSLLAGSGLAAGAAHPEEWDMLAAVPAPAHPPRPLFPPSRSRSASPRCSTTR